MHATRMLCIVTLVLCTGTVGCGSMTQSKGSKKDSPWSSLKFWKKEYQTPQKMAVLWSHDVMSMPGKPPTRGFGGRILFYNEKSQAIPVEGELIVYGYDESKRQATGETPQPDKTFKFTQEQFSGHFSESDLGASYSVWIPWDAAEGVHKEITLVPAFRSSKGEIVQGSASKILLPGRKLPGETGAPPVQTVSFQSETIPTVSGMLPGAENSRPGEVTTFALPLGLGGRGATKKADKQSAPNYGAAELAAIEQAKAKVIAEAMKAQSDALQGGSNTGPANPSSATAPVRNGRFIDVTRPGFGANVAGQNVDGSTGPASRLIPPNQRPQAQASAPQPSGLPAGVELTPQAQWKGSALGY